MENTDVMAPPCTPSPQPGDKAYEDDDSQIPEGVTQIGAPAQYYAAPYYPYATMTNTPHYGQTLMYMPMYYQQAMQQQQPPAGYSSQPLQQDINTIPTPSKQVTVEAPTIVKTPSRQRVVIWNFCQFCQNNREPEEFYRGHILRDAEGKVVCPVLRSYNCPICNNGGGDRAHTKSYCPQLRSTRPHRRSSLF